MATFLLPACCFVAVSSRRTARKQQAGSKETAGNQPAERRKASASLPEKMIKKKNLPDQLMTDFLQKKYWMG
jgi:hypothetical protein